MLTTTTTNPKSTLVSESISLIFNERLSSAKAPTGNSVVRPEKCPQQTLVLFFPHLYDRYFCWLGIHGLFF